MGKKSIGVGDPDGGCAAVGDGKIENSENHIFLKRDACRGF
jgi:hypothetical protein